MEINYIKGSLSHNNVDASIKFCICFFGFKFADPAHRSVTY